MTVCCWQQRQRPIAGTQITGRVTRGGGGPEALSGVADGHWSVGAGEEIWAIKLSLFSDIYTVCLSCMKEDSNKGEWPAATHTRPLEIPGRNQNFQNTTYY